MSEGIQPPVTVRPMLAEDAPAVAALAAELGYPRSVADIQRWIAQMQALDALARTAAGTIPAQTALTACVDGRVVGWIEVAIVRHLQSDAFALIGGLVVSERQRNSGIGRVLCRAAEAWARAQGIRLMRVTSRSTRERAHRFYVRDGYVRVKTSEVFEKALT
jgi:GNAT superfamily N-acetyltransferase